MPAAVGIGMQDSSLCHFSRGQSLKILLSFTLEAHKGRQEEQGRVSPLLAMHGVQCGTVLGTQCRAVREWNKTNIREACTARLDVHLETSWSSEVAFWYMRVKASCRNDGEQRREGKLPGRRRNLYCWSSLRKMQRRDWHIMYMQLISSQYRAGKQGLTVPTSCKFLLTRVHVLLCWLRSPLTWPHRTFFIKSRWTGWPTWTSDIVFTPKQPKRPGAI